MFKLKLELLEKPAARFPQMLHYAWTNQRTQISLGFLRFATYKEDEGYLLLHKRNTLENTYANFIKRGGKKE